MYKKQPQNKPHYYLKLIAQKNLVPAKKNCFYLTRCEPGTCGSKCCLYPEEIISLLSAWKKENLTPFGHCLSHLDVYNKIYYTNAFVWLDITPPNSPWLKTWPVSFFSNLQKKIQHTYLLSEWSIKPYSRKKVQETYFKTNFKWPIYVQSKWIKISLILKFMHPNQTAIKHNRKSLSFWYSSISLQS